MPEIEEGRPQHHHVVFGKEVEVTPEHLSPMPDPQIDSPIGYFDQDGIYHSPMASCQTVICTIVLIVTSAVTLLIRVIF